MGPKLGRRILGMLGPNTTCVVCPIDVSPRVVANPPFAVSPLASRRHFSYAIAQVKCPRRGSRLSRAAICPEAASEFLLDAGRSRVPVYDETIDEVVGLLDVKDLLAAQWHQATVVQTAPLAWTQLLWRIF